MLNFDQDTQSTEKTVMLPLWISWTTFYTERSEEQNMVPNSGKELAGPSWISYWSHVI